MASISVKTEDLTSQARILADEIYSDPDRAWQASVLDRYKAFVRSKGKPDDNVCPLEEWPPGGVEFTEAVLRVVGFTHQGWVS